MDAIGISRKRSWAMFAIYLVAAIGIAVATLPALVSGEVPIVSFSALMHLLGFVVGSGGCLAIAYVEAKLLLDRRAGLMIVGDRLEIHPFWMTERSIALASIARVTFEQYEFFMSNSTHALRHRLRVDRKPGTGNGKPLYFETWQMAGGDAAGLAFGRTLATRAGLELENVAP